MMPNKSQNAATQAAQTQTTHKTQVPPKKVYSREFKLETLRLLRSSGKTKVELERELGLYPGQLRLWEKAFNREEGDVQQAFPGTGHQNDAEAEVSRLRRENEILRQERDILKKAIAYGHSPVFSKTQDPS
jgi:transposase